MFSESPRRKSRTSRIIHELLDTPPDLSHTVEAKKPDNACSVQAPAAKKNRVTGETNPKTHHARVCGEQQDPPHEQVAKPVRQSLLRTPNARGHAIWFLQTPMNEDDRSDMGGAMKISRLSMEEETAMNAALETVPSSEMPQRATKCHNVPQRATKCHNQIVSQSTCTYRLLWCLKIQQRPMYIYIYVCVYIYIYYTSLHVISLQLQYIQLYLYIHYFTLFRFTKALCALRRKGITRAGPAAAAQLLSEFSHAVGADLTGLCCVPLDGELSLVPNGTMSCVIRPNSTCFNC